jgi:ketosteroid isomerase-like protein
MKQPETFASPPAPIPSTSDAELAEDRYFAALAAGDVEGVEEVLAEDFLIVDVMRGALVDRTSFVAALRDGLLEFERVQLLERLSRRYGDTAIIVGRTEMTGSLEALSFSTQSRYTHVLCRQRDGRWRLASAQGTRIVEA